MDSLIWKHCQIKVNDNMYQFMRTDSYVFIYYFNFNSMLKSKENMTFLIEVRFLPILVKIALHLYLNYLPMYQ